MELRPVRHAAQLRFQPGDRCGRLTVVGAIGTKHFKRGVAVVFRCRCDCGAEVERDRQTLIRGGDLACPRCSRTHPGTLPPGYSKHPLYRVWWSMIDRCVRPANKSYVNYGARGVSVCERWTVGEGGQTGLECFLADMGARPGRSFTVERRDNQRGYEPDNCVWATRTAQSRNRRGLRMLERNGRVEPASVWAAEAGVPYFTFMRRIERGWSVADAMDRPLRGSST